MKKTRNLFKLKKENKAIKDKIISGIRNLFKLENEDYEKPVRVSNFYINNHIEYRNNGDKNLLIEEYLTKIKTYLKDIIIVFQNLIFAKFN